MIEKMQQLMESPASQKIFKIISNEKIIKATENIINQQEVLKKYIVCLLLLWLAAIFLQSWLSKKSDSTFHTVFSHLIVSAFKIAAIIFITPYLIFKDDYLTILKELYPILIA